MSRTGQLGMGGWRSIRCLFLGGLASGFGVVWLGRADGVVLPSDAGEVRVPTAPLSLFNGKDLSGFRTWLVDSGPDDPRSVFGVADGEIRISGNGLGYLGTVDRFRDYRLVVEYRWGRCTWGERRGKARDSGIFLHARGPDGNSDDGHGAFMAAVECNLFEGATGDFLLIRGHDEAARRLVPRLRVRARSVRDPEGWFTWDPAGDWQELSLWGRVNWRDKSPRWEDRFGFRGPRDVERRPGRWNRVEVVCVADSITVWLNGIRVNQGVGLGWTDGRILLQCEGSEIFFRRVELHPVAPPPSLE